MAGLVRAGKVAGLGWRGVDTCSSRDCFVANSAKEEQAHGNRVW